MEGTPNVLLEAMASALPIVVTELDGVTGVFVRDGIEALVVAQNDWKHLAICLSRLLEDQHLARTFGQQARNRAVASYSLTSVANEYAHMFKRLER